MSAPLILALPSKGRPKEQTDAWLSKAGLTVKAAGGQRGYNALIEGGRRAGRAAVVGREYCRGARRRRGAYGRHGRGLAARTW